MGQLTLNFHAGKGLSIQERFTQFHEANPRVFEVLVMLATDARNRGVTRLGIRNLWERVRWQIYLETRDESGLKLNDHYHSRYVRLLVERHPEFEGFFELRKLRTE